MDEFIDVVEGNRQYVPALYIYNKVSLMNPVNRHMYCRWFCPMWQGWAPCWLSAHHHPYQVDTITIEEVDRLARTPNSIVISCQWDLNLDLVVEQIWYDCWISGVYLRLPCRVPSMHQSWSMPNTV